MVKESAQNRSSSSMIHALMTPHSCKSAKIITDPESGELICENCGEVITDKISEVGRRWRNFGQDSQDIMDRSRTGIPTSLARHDMGLSTVIARVDRDANGRPLDPAMRSKMGRLRLWDQRSQLHTPSERNFRQAFTYLGNLKEMIGLSDPVIEKAAYIYRKAKERNLVRGRTISAILTAATYVAIREMDVLRSLDDISKSTGIKAKELSRSYRLIVSKLDLKIPTVDPTKCIIRVANNLKLSEKIKRRAFELMKEAERYDLYAGKGPMGMAASVIYLVCSQAGELRSQGEIARAAGVTEVTIRNRSNELRKILGFSNVEEKKS